MPKSILLVGLNEESQTFYKHIAKEQLDINVDFVYDAASAIEKIRSKSRKNSKEPQYDGVFINGLDIGSNPGQKYDKYTKPEIKFRGGLTLLKHIRKKEIPSMVLEGIEPPRYIQKAEKLGAEVLPVEMSLERGDLTSKFIEIYKL